jgi:energy-coupling factor transporter transmembrane protein EcfT
MLARGYTGSVNLSYSEKLSLKDYLFGIISTILLVLFILLNYLYA